MRLQQYIIEELNLPKKKWVSVNLAELDSDTKNKLWQMYENTYKSIGLHIEDQNKLTNKYKVSWFIDTDQDPEPDAFIIYISSHQGNKIALLGTDGNKLNKKLLILKVLKLLRTKGWYIEASHKLADMFVSNKVNIIKDPDKIKDIMSSKSIKIVGGEGEYERKIGSIGTFKKRLFGSTK